MNIQQYFFKSTSTQLAYAPPSATPIPPCMPRFNILSAHQHGSLETKNSEGIRASLLKTQSCCDAMKAAAAAAETYQSSGLAPYEVKHIVDNATLQSQSCEREIIELQKVLIQHLTRERDASNSMTAREALTDEIRCLLTSVEPKKSASSSAFGHMDTVAVMNRINAMKDSIKK